MLHKNTFTSGLNTDVDEQILEPTFYTEAHNLELVGDGKFFALKNIKGTTHLENIINVADTRVLGVFENNYKIGANFYKGLTIITANSSTINIYAYDTENDDLYELYQETTPADYLTDDRIVDARAFAENGVDNLYFTDYYNEIRQLRCEIPQPYVANYLSALDISLQRYGANGIISVPSDVVQTGGSLLSGTYQFAYRMVDPDTKRFTKWSSLTNPIHVYIAGDSTRFQSSAIGVTTSKKIVVDITPSTLETDNFDYFQLAVIENVTTVTPTTASLLPIELNAALTNYEYKANYKVGTVNISDIVTDLAAIKTAKTLAIQQSRLFAGNIKYHELSLDNGTPTISSGSVLTSANPYTEIPASRNKGYFRGEVYRFAIVYFDKYGNQSPPYVLDLSGVTDNQISGAIDMKFPDRYTSNSFALLNGGHAPVSLGLQLNGIDNHPTWAVGFKIVREKRLKRVLFQSPVIPYTTIKGTGAFLNYPSLVYTDSGNTDVTSAQPMSSSEVFVPKNLLWPETRKVVENITRAGSGTSRRYVGEAKLERDTDGYNIMSLFPYEGTFTGVEELQMCDYVSLKVNKEDFLITPESTGISGKSNSSHTFHALRSDQYYFDSAHAKGSLSETTSIVEALPLDNLSEGGVISGRTVLKYSDLVTDGVTVGGTKPSVCKQTVIKTDSSFSDEGADTIIFSSGTHNAYVSGGYITGASGPQYKNSANYSNVHIDASTYGGTTENSSLVQVLRVCNVVDPNMGDTRYGAVDSQREFINTGAQYTFSTSELVDVAAANPLPINIAVWGGDCFVSHHTFKICDSTFSVVNITKQSGFPESRDSLVDSWGKVYLIPKDSETDSVFMMPAPLAGCSQFVQLYLESEHNGEALAKDILTKGVGAGLTNVSVMSSKQNNRSPLTYNYNKNLNKNNEDKIYIPIPETNIIRYDFNSRVNYSDIKIYNSSEQGFDVFRVANIFDQEESGGPITKLALAGDSLYSIQTKRISYLPVGERLLESTDAGQISVGTSGVITTPRVIDPARGSQHLKAIVETGGSILIPDNFNKAIYSLNGQELSIISDKFVASLWRDNFGTVIAEKDLISVHDPIRKEYWIVSPDFCYLYNYALEKFIGDYEFTNLLGGKFTNQGLYLIGKESNQISVYSMYTGTNSLFGATVVPRVKFVVNPEADFSKTFDDMMFVATDRLDYVDLEVERESALGDQTVSNMSLDAIGHEGNFRVKTLRDSSTSRLRGLRMFCTTFWKSSSSVLSGVFTKYRLSARTPF